MLNLYKAKAHVCFTLKCPNQFSLRNVAEDVTFEDENQWHHLSFTFSTVDSHFEGRVSSFRSSFFFPFLYLYFWNPKPIDSTISLLYSF